MSDPSSRASAGSATGAGLAMGVAAYTLWGVFPIYFPLLEPAGPVEIVAQRILWSAIVMALVVLVMRRTSHVAAALRSPRTVALLGLAALTISLNWGTFVYGVNAGHVIEASLGYFINPLVTVLMGVLVLRERLRRAQWASLALAAAAVLVLAVDYGRVPWVALILALSFGCYGLLKKTVGVGAIEGLALETALIAPIALGVVIWLGASGRAVFGTEGPGQVALFVMLGVITAVPLLLFGGSALRLPLVVLGPLQYLAPILQFLLGVLWFGEHMPLTRWVGFALVWTALVVFTLEMVVNRRRQLRLTALAASA